MAGSYDLPFGKGRRYLSNVHPVLNAIIGGWQTSHLLLINSGPFLRFGQMITDGSNPKLANPTRYRWFDTSKFQHLRVFPGLSFYQILDLFVLPSFLACSDRLGPFPSFSDPTIRPVLRGEAALLSGGRLNLVRMKVSAKDEYACSAID